MKFNFILKELLPVFQRRWLVIEDEVIPLLLNTPCTNHEEIHEVRATKVGTLMP
jgi:hypothetical protein